MAIPSISRANVLAALGRIDREGVAPARQSTHYVLVHGGEWYPPKLVVSLAVEAATGRPLDPGEFSGGRETNSLLQKLGFEIRDTLAGKRVPVRDRKEVAKPASRREPRVGARESSVPDSAVRVYPKRRSVTDVRPAKDGEIRRGETVIARVVVTGRPGNPMDGERMLLEVLEKQWPSGLHVNFLTTPGGFVAEECTRRRTGVSWSSVPEDIGELLPLANRLLERTVSRSVRKAAEGKADVLTVGVDLDITDSDGRERSAQLVAVCDLKGGAPSWTGKSYPLDRWEEINLIQVVDLDSHFVKLRGERVLVIGCHDLNMFNPRVTKRPDTHISPMRKARVADMLRRTRRFGPTIVLHHPHGTDSTTTWTGGWSGLQHEFRLKSWASGIAWYNIDDSDERCSLDEVCVKTADQASVKDFIANPKAM